MKTFSVPIKSSLRDYTNTVNVWLSLNDHSLPFDFFKIDNDCELLLGVFGKYSKIKQEHIIATRKSDNIQDLFQEIAAGDSFSGDMLYFQTKKASFQFKTNGKTICLIIRRKDKSVSVLNADTSDISFQNGDSVFMLENKVSPEVLQNIAKQLTSAEEFSYALSDKISDLLSETQTGARPLAVIQFVTAESYSFTIPSTLNAVTMTIDMIKNKVLKYHYDKIWKIETVLHEALVNAITYGNELDDRKLVTIQYEVGENGLRIIVRDEGEGFDISTFSVPVGEEALEKVTGRGIYIMKKFTEALFFNKIGNETLLFFEF